MQERVPNGLDVRCGRDLALKLGAHVGVGGFGRWQFDTDHNGVGWLWWTKSQETFDRFTPEGTEH
jgi:hypothetical protein